MHRHGHAQPYPFMVRGAPSTVTIVVTTPGGTSATSLSKRSGALVAAIAGSVQVKGTTFEDIQGSIGAPGIPYARIQETGGIIRAKNVKFLTIPLPAALNANGTPIMKSARDWPNTFVAKTKAGNLVIFAEFPAQA